MYIKFVMTLPYNGIYIRRSKNNPIDYFKKNSTCTKLKISSLWDNFLIHGKISFGKPHKQ